MTPELIEKFISRLVGRLEKANNLDTADMLRACYADLKAQAVAGYPATVVTGLDAQCDILRTERDEARQSLGEVVNTVYEWATSEGFAFDHSTTPGVLERVGNELRDLRTRAEACEALKVVMSETLGLDANTLEAGDIRDAVQRLRNEIAEERHAADQASRLFTRIRESLGADGADRGDLCDAVRKIVSARDEAFGAAEEAARKLEEVQAERDRALARLADQKPAEPATPKEETFRPEGEPTPKVETSPNGGGPKLTPWKAPYSPEVWIQAIRLFVDGCTVSQVVRECHLETSQANGIRANYARYIDEAKALTGVRREEFIGEMLRVAKKRQEMAGVGA